MDPPIRLRPAKVSSSSALPAAPRKTSTSIATPSLSRACPLAPARPEIRTPSHCTQASYTDTLGQDVAWDTSRRDPVGLTTKVIWDVLRVDHFVVKSHAEFLAKQGRGSPMLPTRSWDGYFEMHNRNDVEDAVRRELVERTKAEMATIAAQIADATNHAPAASPASR
jgi:hypothetical protein